MAGTIQIGEEVYRLDTDKNGNRRWQRGLVSIQDGAMGEPITRTYDTCHLGYGESRRISQSGTYEYTINTQATHPFVIYPGPLVTTVTLATGGPTVTHILAYSNYIWIVAGRYLYKVNPTDDSLSETYDKGATAVGGQPCIFGGKAYFPQGDSVDMQELTTVNTPPTDDTFTSATGVKALHMTVVNDLLWRGYNTSQVSSCSTTPTTSGNWGSAYTIGDSGKGITSLAEYGRWLYIGKADGAYSGDEEGNHRQLLPEIRAIADSTNCHGMTVWHGYLFIPHKGGLYRHTIDGGSRPIGPEEAVANTSPVKGRIDAAKGIGRWLYLSLHTGTDTYILACREREGGEAGVGRLVMHPLAKFASLRCRALEIDGSTSPPRLWMGYGDDLAYIKLGTDGSPDPYDSNYRFATTGGGSIYFSVEDGGNPSTRKVINRIEFSCDQVSTTKTWQLFSKVDDGQWNNVGAPVTQDGVYVRHLLRQGDSDIGKRIQLRADWVSDSATVPPRLFSVTMRGHVLPDTGNMVVAHVALADNSSRPDRIRMKKSAQEQRDALFALAGGEPVTIKDPDGDEARYIISEISEVTGEHREDTNRASVMRLVLKEVDYGG